MRGRCRNYGGALLLSNCGRGRRTLPLLLLGHPALVPIEAPHSLLASRLDNGCDLAELPGPDCALGRRVGHEHFAARDAQLILAEEIEPLADDADKTIRELRQYAALNLRRERHRDPAERLCAG